jgi:hypothetical protein
MREGAAPRQAVTIKTRRPGWGDATRRRWEGLSVVVWWCKLSGGKPDESSTRSSPYVIAGTKPHSGDRTGLARPKMDACLRRPGFDAFFSFGFAEHDTVNQLVYTVGWMNAKGLQRPQSSSRTANKYRGRGWWRCVFAPGQRAQSHDGLGVAPCKFGA